MPEEKKEVMKKDYEKESEGTEEIFEGPDIATTSKDVEREYEKGKTPRVYSDLPTFEGKTTVNPPTGGGKILKDAVGARGHNPGYETGKTYSMNTVRKAEEVVNKGQERINVKWPED